MCSEISIGINQGQKDAARINEVVFNRVQESVQTRKPDIILYHTKIDSKDDCMLNVVKKLNAQGYGQSTYIVAGRLDGVLDTYLDNESDIEKEHMTQDVFDAFMEEIKQIYVESDSVTLNSIIGDILNQIITSSSNKNVSEFKYDDVNFMDIIQRNNVAGNVYQHFLMS